MVQGREYRTTDKTNVIHVSSDRLILDTGGIHLPGTEAKEGHFTESEMDEALRLFGCLLSSLPFIHIHAS